MTGKFRDPWIDRRVVEVRSAAALEYMRRHGWDPVPCPNAHFQMFARPVGKNGERLTQPVPLFEDADEYVQRIIDLITNVATIEDRTAVEVLEEMLGVTAPSGNGTSIAKPTADPAPAQTA
ncbi:MAG TPA: hypothetical protein VKE74_06720 [Gemmataceae bacterium]|nr:hypothetical protein [Gemmataceae bacterium]